VNISLRINSYRTSLTNIPVGIDGQNRGLSASAASTIIVVDIMVATPVERAIINAKKRTANALSCFIFPLPSYLVERFPDKNSPF
jgi:hypothetical protein